MRKRIWTACAAALLSAGCTAIEAPPRGTAEACLPLFEEFDRLDAWHGAGPKIDDFVEVPALQRQGMRLIRADCITRSRHLAAMATGAVPPVAESGAAVGRISVHAGAVAGMGEEAQVRAFFGERGVRVRSIGHPSLGRRIFLGPFATEGGVASAMEAARAVGFQAPYPVRGAGGSLFW